MRKLLLKIGLGLGILSLGFGVVAAQASLSQYYAEQGIKLPSIEARGPLAMKCGIVAISNDYKGTVAQNEALEVCLRERTTYWVDRIKNNTTNPMTPAEFDQIPDEAWKIVTPVLINILQTPTQNNELLGAGETPLVRQVICHGVECDKYFKAERKSEMVGFSVATGYKTTLGSSMTAVQATIPVSSMAVRDGSILSASDLGGKVFLSIEPGSSREEITKCTDSTSVLWSSCSRGLAFSGTNETASTTLAKAHNAGSVVVMSNVHYVYDQLVDKDSTETIGGNKTATGTWNFDSQISFDTLPTSTTSTPTLPGHLITLDYLTTVSSTGCANASASVRGCVQEATNSDLVAGTSTGSTGSRLYIPISQTATTSAGAADTNKVVRLKANGTLDSSFGGVSSSFATLDANAKIVQSPSNATSSISSSSIVMSDSSSTIFSWTLQGDSFTTGEVITANDIVYVSSTGLVYKASAADSYVLQNLIGVALNTVGSGVTVHVQFTGVVSGFSGLTTGTYYFASSTAGQITTDPVTTSLQVGLALTSSKLLIKTEDFKQYQTESVNITAANVQTTVSTGLTLTTAAGDNMLICGAGTVSYGDGSSVGSYGMQKDGSSYTSIGTHVPDFNYYNHNGTTCAFDRPTAGSHTYRMFVSQTNANNNSKVIWIGSLYAIKLR